MEATLWFANKEMSPSKVLRDYVGKNEKTKIVVKLSTKKAGRPTAESWISPETHKKLAVENFKRMEEMKRLERDKSDDYLNSPWADGGQMKRTFQGMGGGISWK